MSALPAAFTALLDLAQRSRQAAKGLPAQAAVVPHWSGIGFQLMNYYMVAPLGEFSELLEFPSYTKLPGVQPWVLGVANVRGRLLPLFDMAAFFGSRLEGQRKKHRVLVLETDGLYSGLVVDTALGMQHFPVETYTKAVKEMDDELRPFIKGSYAQTRSGLTAPDQRWYVFSPMMLAQEARFVNAAQ
jgi:twitching motility protein PilI